MGLREKKSLISGSGGVSAQKMLDFELWSLRKVSSGERQPQLTRMDDTVASLIIVPYFSYIQYQAK
jgi:hypothetical protein